jgi:CPA2 family monovalent cation:H+ antiporter-2
LNIDTVRALRETGRSAIYGEASDPDTLVAAGIRIADTLILSASGLANGPEVIRVARALNPRLTVMARVAYLRDVEDLRAAGADTVYSGEGEVALAFTAHMLERLGATAEQIERERARARDALAGGPATMPA